MRATARGRLRRALTRAGYTPPPQAIDVVLAWHQRELAAARRKADQGEQQRLVEPPT
jgi:hypothetical protein